MASVVFYIYWDPRYLALLLSSILLNYLVGWSLATSKIPTRRKLFLVAGVMANLGILFWFKYAVFALSNLDAALGIPDVVHNIVLPLGISFFTFTQIAFIVDVYQGKARESDFIKFALFVTYFPHLIAGPIIHHKEMMPQFDRMRLNWRGAAIGISCFVFGLAKKDLIADTLAPIANAVFAAAGHQGHLSLLESWVGALAYTFQLYFDFSGYSDMAIGLSLLFGVRLPQNFNSPYKSTSVIEFWQRWHMTLSRFLREYLYIPLGGNRKGITRRYLNLLITMLLGGLWHGAGWTFILWGALHGVALALNHAWRALAGRSIRLPRPAAWTITFVFILLAWIPFRSPTLQATMQLWQGMAMGNLVLPATWRSHLGFFADILASHGVFFTSLNMLFVPAKDLPVILLALSIALLLPNTQQIMRRYHTVLESVAGESNFLWHANWRWAALTAGLAALCLLCLFEPTTFIYFQF